MATPRRLTVLAATTFLVFAGAQVIVPEAATAAALPCASSARITGRSGSGYIEWAGQETRGKLVRFTGTVLRRGNHFYELHNKTVKLSFGHNTFTLSKNAVFDLGCSGLAAGDRAVMPSISMLRGTATVHTTRAVEGSVYTEEGLNGQVPKSAGTTYSVVRKLRQHTALTMAQRIKWYRDFRNQPTGATTAKTKTRARINVTPNVGTHHGTCRRVHSAKLTTTTAFGHGTAVYHF